MASPQAFALLVLSEASLSSGGNTETGYLALECVTITHPGATSAQDRDVYLVLRVNTTETPLDPERPVQRLDGPGSRVYSFLGTPNDPTDLTLTLRLPNPQDPNYPAYLEDLETFEGILRQYHSDFRTSEKGSEKGGDPFSEPTSLGKGSNVTIGGQTHNKDLRGHLVMVDEKSGEVVGEVEDRFRIQEDPAMHARGHENDPVVIEVSEDALTGAQSDANALTAFARIVTPDQANWITNTATVVSSAISLTTNLVVTTITAASNLYISHSKPSPHHSGASTPVGDGPSSAGSSRGSAPPLPPRPKALVFLTSENTRKNLSKVHAVSGEAVKVSAKTVGYIDSMIRRAMGAKPKRDRTAFMRTGTPSSTPPPSAATEKGGLAPPPYSGSGSSRSPSPGVPPPLPPRDRTKLTNKDRILISADLILSTIDDSTRKILDAGTQQVGKVMHHKYGEEAAHSSMMMANTARNVGLVYVDMRGVGRRALLKRAGKNFIKARFSSNEIPVAQPAASGAATPARN
ncbi:hypothetical protein NMY22_g4826 [Coprinellus aureogranulatus]|nr:hypothetical protein NMY22_g4826 [Coprinellus aureogranulatus]